MERGFLVAVACWLLVSCAPVTPPPPPPPPVGEGGVITPRDLGPRPTDSGAADQGPQTTPDVGTLPDLGPRADMGPPPGDSGAGTSCNTLPNPPTPPLPTTPMSGSCPAATHGMPTGGTYRLTQVRAYGGFSFTLSSVLEVTPMTGGVFVLQFHDLDGPGLYRYTERLTIASGTVSRWERTCESPPRSVQLPFSLVGTNDYSVPDANTLVIQVGSGSCSEWVFTRM